MIDETSDLIRNEGSIDFSTRNGGYNCTWIFLGKDAISYNQPDSRDKQVCHLEHKAKDE